MQVEDVDSDSDCDWNPDNDFKDCELSDYDESDATEDDGLCRGPWQLRAGVDW